MAIEYMESQKKSMVPNHQPVCHGLKIQMISPATSTAQLPGA
jgi:hypothetical protein